MATTTVDPTVHVLEVLDQFTNYERWSWAVKNYLLSEGLWDVVEDHKPSRQHEPDKYKLWRKNDPRALRIIQNGCATYINSRIINKASSAKDAWYTLKNVCEPVYFDITEKRSYDVAIDGNIGHLSDTQELVPNEIEDTNNVNEHEDYKEFFSDVEEGNWHPVMKFLAKNPGAIRAKIPKNMRIALHIAVLKKELHIVEQLVDLMKEEDLEIKDQSEFTAFYYAVDLNNLQMVKCMVEKNKKLLSSGFTPSCALPVLRAYAAYQWDVAQYLYHNTPLNALKSRSGAELISQSFTKKKFEIGWDLIHRCPSLALARDFFGHSPLNALAGMRCAFLSGKQLNFWEQWIYDSISIALTMDSERNPLPAINDVRINVQKEETNEDNQRNSNLTGGSFGQLAASLLRRLFPGKFKHIHEMKSVHVRCSAFLSFMCKEIKNKNLEKMQLGFVQSAIFRAVEQGHIEFIEYFLEEYPDCKGMTDAKGTNMFQYAVECRQAKVYKLIYGLEDREIRKLMDSVDDSNNSVLHLVGRLPSYGQLDRIKDATLRMQRELQWFKKVEKIVPRSAGDLMNITDSMTPSELFTKNHKELKKEAEKSMKSTATSCTVVGTLIITTMFAAAFTVPGGKNGGTGIPKLLYKKLVMVYLVSDAISLCFSSTSVIIFLGILTSRYAEVDFLKLLPTKMIFGILTLFFAIITMMIAFSCALYIMFEGKPGTGVLVILLGAIPVISFVLMKFRLLIDMVDSTYGVKLFKHRKLDEVEPWK